MFKLNVQQSGKRQLPKSIAVLQTTFEGLLFAYCTYETNRFWQQSVVIQFTRIFMEVIFPLQPRFKYISFLDFLCVKWQIKSSGLVRRCSFYRTYFQQRALHLEIKLRSSKPPGAGKLWTGLIAVNQMWYCMQRRQHNDYDLGALALGV